MLALRYLRTAQPGLVWMRAYYRRNPHLDLARALASLKRAEDVIREFPQSAKRFEDFESIREAKIHRTAFSLLYTVARETVWVIDLRDQRGFRSAEALRSFTAELRERHGIVLKDDP